MIVADEHHTVKEWIRKYSDIFYNYIYKRLPDKTAANDILQETFIAAWKNFSSLKKKQMKKPGFFPILKNKLVDHVSKTFLIKVHACKGSTHHDYILI